MEAFAVAVGATSVRYGTALINRSELVRVGACAITNLGRRLVGKEVKTCEWKRRNVSLLTRAGELAKGTALTVLGAPLAIWGSIGLISDVQRIFGQEDNEVESVPAGGTLKRAPVSIKREGRQQLPRECGQKLQTIIKKVALPVGPMPGWKRYLGSRYNVNSSINSFDSLLKAGRCISESKHLKTLSCSYKGLEVRALIARPDSRNCTFIRDRGMAEVYMQLDREPLGCFMNMSYGQAVSQ